MRVLGRNTEIIIPTYEVLVHGIKINGNDPGDLKMAVKPENENASNFSDACIKYTGWLTRSAMTKKASSMIVEFDRPEDANRAIDKGVSSTPK